MKFNIRRLTAVEIYFTGLLLLAASLPVSMFMMSVSQFVLAGAWILCGNLKQRFSSFLHNKPAMLLSAVFLMHIAGLLYTNYDFNYALRDIRIKIPLLIMPFLI